MRFHGRFTRWIGGLAEMVVIATAGCSPGVTDPGYYLVNGGESHAKVTPDAYMAAVGCVEHTGARDSATVGVITLGGVLSRFECGTANHDSVSAAIGRYKSAAIASLGGSSMTAEYGGDGAVYDHTSYSCDVTNYYQYVPADGEYVYTYSDATCTFWEVYTNPGGGAGGMYAASTNPTMIPVQPDTTSLQCSKGDYVGCPKGAQFITDPTRYNRLHSGIGQINDSIPYCHDAKVVLTNMDDNQFLQFPYNGHDIAITMRLPNDPPGNAIMTLSSAAFQQTYFPLRQTVVHEILHLTLNMGNSAHEETELNKLAAACF